MIPIQGERFQELCGTQISQGEHKQFELNYTSIDIDNYNFNNFENSKLVYVNSSLLNTSKPKLIKSRLYHILSKFKNPFTLILHNSDDDFGEPQLKYLDVPNCKQIFTQNMNVRHPKVKPLPIGMANHCWKWGDSKVMDEVINEGFTNTRPYSIYANFTKGDGVRYERRSDCYDNIIKQKIPFQKNKGYKSYLKQLKKFKFCISPEGNGIDCYRTWEALYMKTIPICKRSIMIEEFAKIFPIYIIDDWGELDINKIIKSYDSFNWDNWYLLDFETYCMRIGL